MPLYNKNMASKNQLKNKNMQVADCAREQTLYMIATPIGNLRDITLRALDILASVDVIVCESLNKAHRLLYQYQIRGKQLLVCGAKNEEASAEGVVKLLQKGQSLAYISDAGTPGLNDPGAKLLAKVRKAGFTVEALPGPSALGLMASLASCSCKPLSFVGFLSPKHTRKQRELQYWLGLGHSFLLYESPFRLQATLEMLRELAPRRELFLGREMTKKNAQFLVGTSDNILAQLATTSPILGECSLLVAAE